MNPHPGFSHAHRTLLGYRHASPNGEKRCGATGYGQRGTTASNRTDSPTTAHCSLFTARTWTYTFSAKERDPETGLSYFGSRYYSSDLSIWLSVDPMASKYPSLSPYTYCANNPVKLVANQIAIGNKGPVITKTSLRSNPRYNPLFPISPCNSPIEVGEFEIQTGWARTTNKYGL